MPRRLKAPDSESFCDSSRLRAISSLLDRMSTKRPVTQTEITPRKIAMLTEKLFSSRLDGRPLMTATNPQFTVTAAKKDMDAAKMRMVRGLVNVGDFRNSS